MRTHLKRLVVVFCLIAGGCSDVLEPEAPSPQASATPSAALGTTEQSVCVDCLCPRGTRCGFNGTCMSYPLFGPVPIPPMAPPCVCDRQCGEGWTLPAQPGRGAARCELSGTYGYCVNPTCELYWSAGSVAPGGTVTLSVTSSNLPEGSYLRLYGTRNGVVDEAGSLFNLVSGSFPITNSAGLEGSYVRYIRIFGPDHAQLCESPHAAVEFQ